MKKLFFTILMLSPAFSQAQRFQRYYQPPVGLSGSDVLTTGIDNVTISGGAAAGYFQPTSFRSLRFVRFDDAGAALINQRYDLRTSANLPIEASYATSMTSRISAGVQSYTVTGQVGSGSTRDALFMQIATTGTAGSVRRFSFGTGSVDEGTCIRPSSLYADNFYMCGNTTPANATTTYPWNFFLVCTNGSGTVQRGIVYSYNLVTATGAPLYTSASALVEDPANNVVWIVGQAIQNPTAAGAPIKSGLLVKINGTNGNLMNAYLYDQSIGANGRVEGFKAIRKLSDQKFIVLGSMNFLPSGGTSIGAGLAGDVLIKFDLLGAAPIITWQKGYNFNTGTAASIAPLSGKDVIEVQDGATSSYWVCGKYPSGNQKAVFRVDALGNHLGNSIYEAGKFGDLFAMAQTNDPRYPVGVLAFGSSPSGNFTRSYIMKALPTLVTVSSASCPQRTLSKYEVPLNLTRTFPNSQRATGTTSIITATSSTFSSDFCAIEPNIVARESATEETSEAKPVTTDFRAMTIYPNPVTTENEIHISIQTEATNVDVEILDIMGRKIQIEKVSLENSRNEFTLNLADIKSGQYLLRVTTHEGVRSLRFIRK